MSAAQPLTSTGAGLAPAPALSHMHTLSLFVHDRPGVLVRVAIVFARRGYNIESLVVSPAARAGFSRMTITCSGDPTTLEQIIKQLAKLVDVVHAIDHTGQEVIESEIALMKLECGIDERTQILQIADQFKCRVVDYGPESLVIRSYGSSEKIDALILLLEPYRLTELVRSGKVIMTRGIETT
ncbi:MAG: acetolactate synthase small subunit [Myxococcota bacterium]|jgi:acetolactate synthase-1/3 small subunit|nr:acetolactate synthase small subunit [Myxococcota bacterium]